jgi:tetratricopeptide (TPR) repeat protein
LIRERGLAIAWAAISRVDLVDLELLESMRKAGCVQVSYGVESGDEKIRRKFNKNFSERQIVQAFKWTSRCGILPRAYFIYGSPGESWETINATVELIERIQPLSAIFYILTLYPGTALFDDFRRRSNASDDIWMEMREDILYFETDATLTGEQVRAFGRHLRQCFYRALPRFALNIDLIEESEWYPWHADFCSRLGLTFHTGDYAKLELDPDSQSVAMLLYRRAIAYHPDARAYLGMGMLAQHQRQFEQSVELLSEGAAHFPQHPQLNICLAVSLMNLGRFAEAETRLAPWRHLPEAWPYLQACYNILGQHEKAKAFDNRLSIRDP